MGNENRGSDPLYFTGGFQPTGEEPVPDPDVEEFPGYVDEPLIAPDDGTISYGDPNEGD